MRKLIRVDSSRRPLEREQCVVVAAGLARGVGNGPVDCRLDTQKLRTHLADPIAERDDVVEPAVGESVRLFERAREMSIPRSRMTRTAFECSGFGLLPARRSEVVETGRQPSPACASPPRPGATRFYFLDRRFESSVLSKGARGCGAIGSVE
jgi:hypothetical protein